jgi:RNA polymerase sigma-70 factor (ECF subfamily)
MRIRIFNRDSDELATLISLLTEHQWALRGYILSLMPGSSDVDDVLQETNIVLWKKRARFDLGTNFMAWASRVAFYEVMHHRDRKKKDQSLPFSDDTMHLIAETLAPRDSKLPLLTALEHCLGKLGEKHRELVMVRYTRGKSLIEHAQGSGTTAESLRVTLHRIRQTLKRCVEAQSRA